MGQLILQYESGHIYARRERSQKTLVREISFQLREGESLSLIGETGSGKTMIALSILGLLPPNVRMEGGGVSFLDRPLPGGKRRRKLLGVDIVYIPQNGLEFLNPSKKVKHHLFDNLKKLGVPSSGLLPAAKEALAAAGFPHPEALLDKYPFQLSGGMAQRVTIAISACSQAKLILADEPTNGLDDAAKTAFKSMLDTLFPSAAKLIITHDITLAALCDRTLVLCAGRMMEQGPSGILLSTPRHPYTQALLGSLVKN